MKKSVMPLLAVAFVAAIVATGIFYGLLIPRLRGTDVAKNASTAVVAVRALDRGAVLRAEDLEASGLPAASLPADALRDPNELVGRTLLEPVGSHQPLTRAHVTPRATPGGASLAIPAGMRAVTIHPGDSAGVVSLLRSGSKVDIQVLERGSSGNVPMQLRRLLEDVEVLSAVSPEASNRPSVTLLVSPRDADRLSLADAAMQIRLVLRNPSDRAREGQAVWSPATLFDPARQPQANLGLNSPAGSTALTAAARR